MTMHASRGEMSRAVQKPVIERSRAVTRTSRCWLERFSPMSLWRRKPASAPAARARRFQRMGRRTALGLMPPPSMA